MILLPPPSSLVVSVDGDGSLRFAKDGALVYARRATLHSANGLLVNEAGLSLVPRVSVAGAFSISLDGTISSGGKVAGRLVLANVAGGRATLMNPGEGLAGVIRTGSVRTAAGGASAASLPKTASSVTPTYARPTLKTVGTRAGTLQAAPISVVVRVESQLEGDRLLLGGIAEIEAPAGWQARLAALDLGLLPPIGATRLIGLDSVRAALRGLGLTPEKFTVTVPYGSKAMRSGTIVETQAILDEALQGHEGYVSARPITPLAVPKGKLRLVAGAPQTGVTGLAVEVKATVDGKPAGSRIVSLVPDPSVPTAKVGEAIRLRLISGGATIEIPAKVKIAGRLGSDITVVTETGSVHTGRLLPNGLIEVRL